MGWSQYGARQLPLLGVLWTFLSPGFRSAMVTCVLTRPDPLSLLLGPVYPARLA